MIRFVLQRAAQTVIVLLGVTVLVFAVLRIIPGDPVALVFTGDDEDGVANAAEARREYAERLGLDRPLPVQYAAFLSEAARGDLGQSLRRNTDVSALVGQALPLTVELTAAGMVIAIVVALPVAVLGALRQNTWWDRGGSAFALIGMSLPSFWQGIMLIMLFAVTFPLLPASGVIDVGVNVRRITGMPIFDSLVTGNWEGLASSIRHLVLPAITLGTGVAAGFTRILRSSLLEVKYQDFIDAYRARGLGKHRIVAHMIRNALPTTVVIFGMRLGTLLGGTLVIETVFAYPGMGWLLINSIYQRDYPVVQGTVLVMTIIVVLANFASDLLHGWLDPRVKVGAKI